MAQLRDQVQPGCVYAAGQPGVAVPGGAHQVPRNSALDFGPVQPGDRDYDSLQGHHAVPSIPARGSQSGASVRVLRYSASPASSGASMTRSVA